MLILVIMISKLIKRFIVLLVFIQIILFINSEELLSNKLEFVKIGVLAKRGKERCLSRWKKTAKYLSSVITDHKFEIVPVGFDIVEKVVKSNEIEFILVNPMLYVSLEVKYEVSRLVTMQNLRTGKPYTQFGGVIFCRKDSDIMTLHDIVGKSFMAVDKNSFGGWHMGNFELHKLGIDPHKDFKEFKFGKTHDNVVISVFNRTIDAGTVRTDTLESMEKEGKIKLSDFRILNQHSKTTDFPFEHSTILYPEWPLAKLKETPVKLANQVAVALLKIEPDNPAAICGNYNGWAVPSNYQSVHETLKKLKESPYEKFGEVSFKDVLKQYGMWLFTILIMFLFAVMFAIKSKFLSNQLSYALEKSNELTMKVEKASSAKGDFLANMSHEIRTPMNAVLGLSDLMMKTKMDARQRDYLKKIKSSSIALLGLINNILDFSKIESGKIELERVSFDFDELLNNLSNVVTLNAEKKGLEIIFSVSKNVPKTIIGDSLRLNQVLINLFNNALKFTSQGHVMLKIEVLEKKLATIEKETIEKNLIKFSVIDTGIGISKKNSGKIFGSFSQADGLITRNFGGTGLGLSICRSIVELMEGNLKVESEEGSGAIFSFSAWLESDLNNVTTNEIDYKNLINTKALVVDDNKFAREVISSYLENFSMEVDTVTSGEAALKVIKDKVSTGESYDFVFMDYKMEGMNGIEATKKIKELKHCSKIPSILMITAFGKEEVNNQAINSGVDSFLHKPINQSILFDALMDITNGFGHAHLDDNNTIIPDNIIGARLLIAEDNSINQQIIYELLKSDGFFPILVKNGLETIKKLKIDYDFDAILMDIQMPIMDGRTATKIIRQMKEPINGIPIIALTAHALESEKEKSLAAGMNSHITKPIVLSKLYHELSNFITTVPVRNINNPSKDIITNESDNKVSIDDITVIDINIVLKRLNNNKILLKKLLKEFYIDYVSTREKFNRSFIENEHQFIERTSHTIKGIAGTFGTEELIRSAAILEESSAKGKETREELDNFNHDLYKILDSIGRMELFNSEKQDKDKKIELSSEKVKVYESKLHDLKVSLKSCSISSIDLFQEISQYLKQKYNPKKIYEIQTDIDNFDYQEAHDKLCALKG